MELKNNDGKEVSPPFGCEKQISDRCEVIISKDPDLANSVDNMLQNACTLCCQPKTDQYFGTFSV